MNGLRCQRRVIVVLTVLYALSMAMLGLSHAGRAEVSERVDLAAYSLPDGSMPALCLNGGDAPGSDRLSGGHCAACQLAAAPGLPGPGQVSIACPLCSTRVVLFVARAVPPTIVTLRDSRPRGPPSIG